MSGFDLSPHFIMITYHCCFTSSCFANISLTTLRHFCSVKVTVFIGDNGRIGNRVVKLHMFLGKPKCSERLGVDMRGTRGGEFDVRQVSFAVEVRGNVAVCGIYLSPLLVASLRSTVARWSRAALVNCGV
jgi:hypothetical protein